MLAVIAKLQKAEIRLCPFSEPSNSEGALALAISTPLKLQFQKMRWVEVFCPFLKRSMGIASKDNVANGNQAEGEKS